MLIKSLHTSSGYIKFIYINTVYFTDLHQKNIQIETEDIVTPMSGNLLRNCWEGYHNRDYIASGFRNGFAIGIPGLSNANALKLREIVMWSLKSWKLSWRQVEYSCSPMPTAVFSPSYVIPKSTPGKFCVIHDLSKPTGCSVNSNIPDSLKLVKYCSVIQVWQFLQEKTTTDGV